MACVGLLKDLVPLVMQSEEVSPQVERGKPNSNTYMKYAHTSCQEQYGSELSDEPIFSVNGNTT